MRVNLLLDCQLIGLTIKLNKRNLHRKKREKVKETIESVLSNLNKANFEFCQFVFAKTKQQEIEDKGSSLQ